MQTSAKLRRLGRLRQATQAPGALGLRPRLVLGVLIAVAPVVLLASGLALRNAGQGLTPELSAGWLAAAALPFALGVVAVLMVSWTIETHVLRWLEYLERTADLYRQGRYGLRPSGLEPAATEFRTLGAAVSEMAEAIEARDRELRDALEQQTMLVREVHHRVKNTLQIITSQLGQQAARAPDDTVRAALVESLIRVDALSLAQRYIVQEEAVRVDGGSMLHAFADQARGRLRSGARFALSVDAATLDLPVTTATTLLLIAAEALITATNCEDPPAQIGLGLARDGDGVRLWIEAPGRADMLDGSPYARTLIDRYARQLKGRLEPTRDSRIEVTLPSVSASIALMAAN